MILNPSVQLVTGASAGLSEQGFYDWNTTIPLRPTQRIYRWN
jgi:hypothetical protein